MITVVLLRRFDHRRHGSLGAGKPPIRTVGVNLVAREFRVRQFADDQNRAAATVHFFGVPVGLIQGEDEDPLEHLDHVVVGVIVVVQEHDPVERNHLVPFYDFRFGRDRRLRHDAPATAGMTSIRYCAPPDNSISYTRIRPCRSRSTWIITPPRRWILVCSKPCCPISGPNSAMRPAAATASDGKRKAP